MNYKIIDPKKELFKWGPIDGKILYIEFYTDYLVSYQKKLKKSWPDMLNHIKNNKVFIILENKKLRDKGKQLFMEYIIDKKKSKETYNHWHKIAKKIEAMCYIHRNSDLSKLSNQELLSLLVDLFKIYEEFWVYGFIPEVANWGGETMLIEIIKRQKPQNFNEIFETLTAPERLSFYNVEERDLLISNVEEHAKKYFWIQNSYNEVKFVTIPEFKERLKELSKDKVKKIDNFASETLLKKEKIKEKFSLPQETMDIASRLSFSIWWQDLRKKYIFMGLHVINHFAKEIAARNKLTLEEIEMYNPEELLKLAENGVKIDLIERKKGYLAYYHEEDNSISYKYGNDANKIISKYTTLTVDANVDKIIGMVASKGKATGRVRILSGARHFDSMQKGEILVTSMTSPEFVVAMRKAAAIVTDFGGITCHAAIVSRELGVPCIVGTEIAPRVLKNGDLVEVDAEKGIVKKLNY